MEKSHSVFNMISQKWSLIPFSLTPRGALCMFSARSIEKLQRDPEQTTKQMGRKVKLQYDHHDN